MGYPFVPSFLFPNINLSEILELEFKFAYTMGIPIEFDHKEFREFIWYYERLAAQREEENKQNVLNQQR